MVVDRGKVIQGLLELIDHLFHEYKVCYHGDEEDCYNRFLQANNAMNLLNEQEAEIRQLRLALDIAKGTCKGINVERIAKEE